MNTSAQYFAECTQDCGNRGISILFKLRLAKPVRIDAICGATSRRPLESMTMIQGSINRSHGHYRARGCTLVGQMLHWSPQALVAQSHKRPSVTPRGCAGGWQCSHSITYGRDSLLIKRSQEPLASRH